MQEEKRRIEVEQKAQEEAIAAQTMQAPKEKEVVDLTSHIEHLKKVQRDKNLEEQWAVALAQEKNKEGLKRNIKEPVLEPREGRPKKPGQEEEEELENIQMDPSPPSLSTTASSAPPPSSPNAPSSPKSIASPVSPPRTSSSPQQKPKSTEETSSQPPSQPQVLEEVPTKDKVGQEEEEELENIQMDPSPPSLSTTAPSAPPPSSPNAPSSPKSIASPVSPPATSSSPQQQPKSTEETSSQPQVLEEVPTKDKINVFKDWNQGARKVVYWLSVSVQDTMIGHIQDDTSPKQTWDRLVLVDTTNTIARKIQLKNELNTIKKQNLLINDYTLKIKGIAESLASIGVQVEDDDKVEICLHGLMPAYKHFKMSIQTRENISCFPDLVPMLVVEEKNLGEDSSSSQGRNNSEQVFYSNRGRGRGHGADQGQGRGRGNQNQGQQ
ncbi:hypothetical protein L7F22_066865 [Adiantum nelumboides]|nr:hypothetical protein [Adiantum nelumboides]